MTQNVVLPLFLEISKLLYNIWQCDTRFYWIWLKFRLLINGPICICIYPYWLDKVAICVSRNTLGFVAIMTCWTSNKGAIKIMLHVYMFIALAADWNTNSLACFSIKLNCHWIITKGCVLYTYICTCCTKSNLKNWLHFNFLFNQTIFLY